MSLDDPTQTQKMIAQSNKIEVIHNALFPLGTPVKLGTYLRRVDDETAVYQVQSKPVSAPGPSGIQVMKADVMETRLPT